MTAAAPDERNDDVRFHLRELTADLSQSHATIERARGEDAGAALNSIINAYFTVRHDLDHHLPELARLSEIEELSRDAPSRNCSQLSGNAAAIIAQAQRELKTVEAATHSGRLPQGVVEIFGLLDQARFALTKDYRMRLREVRGKSACSADLQP